MGGNNTLGYQLLAALLEYDPTKRLTAQQALQHPYFTDGGKPIPSKYVVASGCPDDSAFEGQRVEYPKRRVSNEDTDIKHIGSLPNTHKRTIDESFHGSRMKRFKGDV